MSTNALIDEKSPYLRQHAHNPVQWLPWGDVAFGKARKEQKPIFLSIGYSTCHWCHVMAHESFEDDRIAALLNRDFVPVKVDREERPDVDRIYMMFVQATTGSGGWPLSVWLTPELKPFYGGTYFPPGSRYGRPGFPEVLEQLTRVWNQDRNRVILSGENVTEQLQAIASRAAASAELNQELFEAAFWQFRRMFDSNWGGFGSAPKFPRPVVFNYLLRFYAASRNNEALDMVVRTLHAMAAGGMHDQLGGGFHRYSVDERWFVPHFEKMLYDQAQLAVAYLEAYQITRDERLANVARDIFQYVLRDLRYPGGAFYSAEDADSPDPEHPGHAREGAFYVWRQAEIEDLLGKEAAAVFNRRYGIEPHGNVEQDPQGEFTGRNILFEAMPLEEATVAFGLNQAQAAEIIASARDKLLAVRNKRPRPHLDNKILTSWNALMISAFAKGYAVLGDQQYKEAAVTACEFILSKMYNERDGQLLRRFCDGEAAIGGFLDDYAFLAQALLDLFEITSEPAFLERAIHIARESFPEFEDEQRGGYYSTQAAPDLLVRMKDDYDGAEPTGNSVATDVLIRLARLTEDEEFRTKGERSLIAAASTLKAQPTAAVQMLVALGRWLVPPAHTVLRCREINSSVRDRLRDERKRFEPNVVTLAVDDHSAPQLSNLLPFLDHLEPKGAITLYRCLNFTCSLPEVLET
jgi:uncharacterized protein